MSTHAIPVVPVELEEHPNADSLSLVTVGGYSVCVRTEDWTDRDRGIYVPPDYVIETARPEFSFLANQARADGTYRVRCKRFRGSLSWGLLIPAPDGAEVGDDFMASLGIKRWEPRIPASPRMMRANEVAPPAMNIPGMYDVENLQNPSYVNVFEPGEYVIATEKIHGANASYVYWDGEFHVKSRKRWIKDEEGNPWWEALHKHDEIKKFLQENPGTIIMGEIYGRVQELRYGLENEVDFIAFDMWRDGDYLPYNEFNTLCILNGIKNCQELYIGDYNFSKLLEVAQGKSPLANMMHVREGIVVRPAEERYDHRCGRVHLKIINPDYLEKCK